MKARRMDPHVLRIKEMCMYIRASRCYHQVRRRNEKDRKMHAEMLRMWRESAWHSYRLLWETRPHLSQGSPWSFYSTRTGVQLL